MKILKCFILFIIIYSCNRNIEIKLEKLEFSKAEITPTKIDSLNSEKEVQQFIRTIDSNYSWFELKKIKDFNRDRRFDIDSFTKRIADSIGVNNSYYFADIDNNGYTDLLFIGDNHWCSASGSLSCNFTAEVIMSFGQDSIKSISLNKDHGPSSFVPEIIKSDNKVRLKVHTPAPYHWIENKKMGQNSKTELVFKFDHLIEINENPTQYQIEKIEFFTEVCHSPCPVFDLEIDKHRNAFFRAKHYNFYNDDNDAEKVEGDFTTLIHDKDYIYITTILNYIDFPNLKDNYMVSWMHAPSSILKITYDNGKTKIIEDFGMIGTYGLTLFYEKLSELRFNQDWKKVPLKFCGY